MRGDKDTNIKFFSCGLRPYEGNDSVSRIRGHMDAAIFFSHNILR
jgi:hypothetical protein